MTAQAALLVADRVTMSFAGLTALDTVSIAVRERELVGLLGPNGAGKTTLFNCLHGALRPTSGTVSFCGVPVGSLPTHRRARLGMGRTFQRMELFAGMSVREHLFVAERSRRGTGRLWKDALGLGTPTTEERARVDGVLDLLDLTHDADRPIEALSLGRARLVELGRALMTEPRLLLLDEPSSGLDRDETRALTEVLRRVHAEHEMAILLVEHDIEMVRSFVDRIYVLEYGTLIAEGSTAEVMAEERVRVAYLGSEAASGADS